MMKVMRLAHTISGVAGTIGAAGAGRSAKEIEEYLRSGGREKLTVLVDAFDRKIAPIFDAITAFFAAIGHCGDADLEASIIDWDAIGKRLILLADCLQHGDAKAIDIVELLMKEIPPSLAGRQLETLWRQVEDYDFDDALRTLEALTVAIAQNSVKGAQ